MISENLILIPIEYEVYQTSFNTKMFITKCYSKEDYSYFYIYTTEDYTDVIVSSCDEEFTNFQKERFVKDRNLKLLKKGGII